ncbi:8-oxo-dGTP pyrophosphatase MutT (NUDIX family) [Kribbella orskensis]|uniref:8-oxo-dGTP pyrophosphatase MutT (NUDIX family) n=1 Tax=Kribbella orskensis TaxID=2512216 RepID=A0ABY2BB49_9ACTN|nr:MULTISPECIES: GNAT family N-acetyltransferase [Kribbella]TCN34244.1 8-oxo-dGTP pyrophosphatase MutT (NUDIX family) [Kribbella sp. VKM Ac-2500]TCO14450.1 8-oxo-dGTP pyrophosphatase MutT (NUDIX family) [Kribbella orskensis]
MALSFGWVGRVITVREIDPSDETLFDGWYDVYRAGAVADRPAAILSSHDALAYSLRTPNPLKQRLPVAAFAGDRVVGAMLFETWTESNLDSIEVEICVPPAERRRGIGTALWGWARSRAAVEERTIFQCELGVPEGFTTETWPGSIFAAKLGFTVQHIEDHLVVPLPYEGAVQVEALDGYELTSWAGPCPEEHLQAFADLRTAMDRDVPTGGMTKDPAPWHVEKLRAQEERVDKTWLSLLTLARTSDGRPAGYTVIYLPRTDPDTAQQLDTLVLREHRGHNLGAHLKLANLEQLARHRTTQKLLHTWTAETNSAMQKVNARFGFRPVEKLVECELKVPVPRLRPAARGVVLDQDDRILLLRFEFDDRPRVWAAPGGGVEPGESAHDALVRELREEVGIEAPDDPPHLWHQVVVADGHAKGYDGVINDYYLVRLDSFTPSGAMSPEELRAENVHGHQWWSVSDLKSYSGPAVFSPRSLGVLLETLLAEGPPEHPLQLAL